MTVGDLFHSDPTRELEEVQKINARERTATDVREFHETESAREVLTELGDVVSMHPGEGERFLYLHATFGSGKTHLLKLIGLVADDESEFAEFGEELATKWPGFDTLRQSIDDSHVDRFKPVFLNLLDRDASKEPPLPFLIYEAIGRELGYPTELNWLLEWAWTVDMEYDGVWDAVTELEHSGRSFDEVLNEKAYLRTWLYEAVPRIPETSGTDLDTEAGVKASVEAAESEVEPESFDPSELVHRVEAATESLNESSRRTELLIGLDEVALFVGDSVQRYREFEETMEALQHGPNPVVVTTGQYSLPDTRESLVGDTPDGHWTHNQVLLEGADTEIIVRKRWLAKGTDGEADSVRSLIDSMPDLTLDTYASITSADPDPVESYPFRVYDLTLLRMVMQELITQGRATDREYIQGRALLVLVRSLFTKFEWAAAEEGALVTWDELFDLLVEETTYVPLWVQEMLENTLIPTFDGDETAWEVRVAKALYLVNQTAAVPETPENLGRLLVDHVDSSVEETVDETREALDTLVDKRKALTETTDQGDEVYTLVSEEQESILSRAQTKAEQISPHQLSAWLETRLRETDGFFRSDGSRHEVDVGSERLVPLRYEYSVLDPVSRAPTPEYDAIRVRVLADDPDTVADQVDTWQEVNDGRDGGEHLLIAINVPETMLDRIRNVIGMGQVLDQETGSHEELQREHRTNKRRLESMVGNVLEDASVYTVQEHRGERPTVLEDTIEELVSAVFGPSRKTLTKPLTAVDDARAMADFFQGSGTWPLSDADAVMLGVGTDNPEITLSGWCREFIDEYEAQKAVDVETVLRQTRTANGDYRGTPRESIAALVITLATSNERVALKQDADFLTDAATIGRKVRTKGGLTSLQVQFDVEIVDRAKVRTFAETMLGQPPAGDGLDEWLAEVGHWIDDNSAAIKRTLKQIKREFDVSLEEFEVTIEAALSGGDLSTSDLGTDEELTRLVSEAETFADARALFVADDGPSLWNRFEDELEAMEDRHAGASVTSSMRTTAESDSIPSVATVESRIDDARAHRVDELSAQYRRITGEEIDLSEPDQICEELAEWLRSNEAEVRDVIEAATAEFDDVAFGEIGDVFGSAWDGEDLHEATLVNTTIVGQARTYQDIRELFDESDGPSLWAEIQDRAATLREEYPDSPTTTSVEAVRSMSEPPAPGRVDQLLDEWPPKPPRPDSELWGDLESIAIELRQELPNADVTEEVIEVVEADHEQDQPSDEHARELLSEAETVLERIRTVSPTLDEMEPESIVMIEKEENKDS